MKKVYIGGDGVGIELRDKIKKMFKDELVDFVDLGLFRDDTNEYQEVVREISEKVNEEDAFGVIVFGKTSK